MTVLDGKEILITGGTGSLGKTLLKLLLTNYRTKGLRIFSRDEYKQWVLQQQVKEWGLEGNVSFILGDIRDAERVERAMKGVDIVYNTAAMKHVPACEYNPIEAIKTNVNGSINIVNAAIKNNVGIVLHVSTDKAVYPVNIYGVSKAAAEKVFIHSNVYTPDKTQFKCVRYGNVLGSRGSIIPLFREQAKTGTITITNPEMTRFWITLPEVAQFIIDNTFEGNGGEIFIPKMKSMKVADLAKVIAPNCKQEIIGIRQGEKIHECLIAEEEHILLSISNKYTVVSTRNKGGITHTKQYTSENADRLSIEELKEKIKGV